MALWQFVEPVAQLSDSATTTERLTLFATSSVIAAGAAVIPDLDHPDARVSTHAGFLSRFVARRINKLGGGHRMATHSLLFALLLGAVTLGVQYATLFGIGRWVTALVCAFCVSIGLALAAPSLGIRLPPAAALAITAGTGWVVYQNWSQLRWLIPLITVYGVVVHIACDAVTKGGVPIFLPFSKQKYALGWFRVGGSGEAVAQVVGVLVFLGLLVYVLHYEEVINFNEVFEGFSA